MKVILKETIEALGIIGSEVTVADGHARNYLLPQNKAVPATPQNRKMMALEKNKFDLQIAKEKEFAEEMAKRLEGIVCTSQSQRGRPPIRICNIKRYHGRPYGPGSRN